MPNENRPFHRYDQVTARSLEHTRMKAIVKHPTIYLDHAASTPMLPEAIEVLTKSLRDDFANPAAEHKLGRQQFGEIENAAANILAGFNGLQDYRIVFTSSATESNNTIIRHFADRPVGTILYSPIEHPSLTEPARWLGQRGHHLEVLPILRDGSYDVDILLDLLDENTHLVSFSHLNNNSGILQDIDKIAAAIKSKNSSVHLHIDAAQSCTKHPISLQGNLIDSMTITGHKVGGPKGIAGLLLRKEFKLSPLLLGGNQQNGFRSSTLSTPLIRSFAVALSIRQGNLSENLAHTYALQAFFRKTIQTLIPEIIWPFAQVNTEKISPYITYFILPGISSDIVMRHLEEQNIYLSSSAACSSRSKRRNQLYALLGIAEIHHKSVLRVSFSPTTVKEELEQVCTAITKVYNCLCRLRLKASQRNTELAKCKES